MMPSRIFLCAFLLWANQVSSNNYIPRATPYDNTSWSSPDSEFEPGAVRCCIIDAWVGQVLWYTSSIEVTVATVSTIVQQYNNTAMTKYQTVSVNNSLPKGYFGGVSISGVPTDLVNKMGGVAIDYENGQLTTLMDGTVFTDPYGVEYTSPTRVWAYTTGVHMTGAFGYEGGPRTTSMVCDAGPAGDETDPDSNYFAPYPSGFWIADDGPPETMAQGELWINVSSQFISWIASHTPPEPYFDCSGCTNMGICAPGSGIGLPTAHIPVNSITAAASTTVIMGGYYGVASPKPSPPPEPSIPPDQANPTLSPPHAAISPGPANPGPISLVATKPTIEASMVVVGTQTVIAGGPAAIISGITYSIPIQGGAVIVNGHTSTLSVYPPGPLPTLIVGSLTYTANSKSEYVIGSQTLTEGGVITASGETFSLAPGGSNVVMISGSSTKIESMGAAIASIGGFATASPSYVTASHASSQQFTSIWVMGFVGLSWVGCMLHVVISDMIV